VRRGGEGAGHIYLYHIIYPLEPPKYRTDITGVMSQSDYIKRKKSTTVLAPRNQAKFPAVLGSDEYTLYKQYSLENTIMNTSPRFNQLVPTGAKVIFNMEVNRTVTCPSFVLCNTQQRVYHVNNHPVAFNPYVSGDLPYVCSYTSTYTPNQLKHIKHRPNRTCSNCCYDRASKKNTNTWCTACSNSRLNHLQCDCSMN